MRQNKNKGADLNPKWFNIFQGGWYFLLILTTAMAAYITWSAAQVDRQIAVRFAVDLAHVSIEPPSENIPQITYAARYDNPPYEYIENGEITGFNIDLLREIATNAGYHVVFVAKTLNEKTLGIRAGEYDIATIATSDQNKESVNFLTTFVTSNPVLLVPANSSINSFSQAQGRVIGVVTNGNMYAFLTRSGFTSKIETSDDRFQLAKNLSDGKYDAILIDSREVGQVLAKKSNYNFNLIDADIPPDKIGFAVPKTKGDLYQMLLKAEKIAHQSGVFDTLSRRWLGEFNNLTWWQSYGRFLVGIGVILVLFSASIYWSRIILQRLILSTAKVAENESKYRALVRQSPDGVLVFNRDGVILEFNAAMERITGMKAEEAIGTFAWDAQWKMFPPKQREGFTIEQLKSFVLRAVETGITPSAALEAEIVDAAGNRKYISQVSYLADTGSEVFTGSVIRDITEGKMASDILKTSEQKFRSLVESLPISIFVKDRSSTYIACNTNFARLIGLEYTSEVVGTNDFQYFAPDEAARHQDNDRRVIELGLMMDYEEVNVFNGKTIAAWVTKAPLLNGNGDIVGVQGCIIDITERKQIKESLARSETRYHQLFEHMRDSFVLLQAMLGEDGSIADACLIDANPAFQQQFGVTVGDIVGNNLSDLLPEYFSQLIAAIGSVAFTGLPMSFETAAENQGRIFHVNAFCPQPGYCAAILQDITATRRAEAEARRTQIAIDNSAVEFFQVRTNGQMEYVNETACRNLGYQREELLQTPLGRISPMVDILPGADPFVKKLERTNTTMFEDTHYRKDGTAYPVEVVVSKFNYESEPFYFVFAYDITERKEADRIISQVNSALRTIAECNQILVRATDENHLLRDICKLLVDAGGYSMGWVGYAQQDEDKTVRPVAKYGNDKGYVDSAKITWSNGERGRGPIGTAIRTMRTVVVNSLAEDPNFDPWRENAKAHGFKSIIALPLSAGGKTFGALGIYANTTDTFVPDAVALLQRMADDLAYGIHAIRNRYNLQIAEDSLKASEDVFSNLVENLPAATVVVDTDGRILYQNSISKKNNPDDPIGKLPSDLFPASVANQIKQNNALALEHKATQSIEVYPTKDGNESYFNTYRFVLPRGGMSPYIGVISVDITALKRAEKQSERSNQELLEAYEKTIEGWARALDLREHETFGHSERVAQITLAFARELMIPNEEMQYIYRGALLHDIGKLGIPDNILLKEGPLTDEEWVIMRKHPGMAYELLSYVPFLQRSIDIPYYHHERWDGSGYPHSIKGNEIPLAARMFAYIDVWDALVSNRPYRRAMEKSEIRAYFKREAGRLFDPDLLEIFLNLECLDWSSVIGV